MSCMKSSCWACVNVYESRKCLKSLQWQALVLLLMSASKQKGISCQLQIRDTSLRWMSASKQKGILCQLQIRDTSLHCIYVSLYIPSVPRGRVPQGRVRAPLAPLAPGTRSLLGVRFPATPQKGCFYASPFWRGTRLPATPQKGCFGNFKIKKIVSLKKVYYSLFNDSFHF